MASSASRQQSVSDFSLTTWLFLLLLAALVAAVSVWLLHPADIHVAMTVGPMLHRYNDGEGNLPLGASVRITNLSDSTIWYLGYPGALTSEIQQLVDGRWGSHTSFATVNGVPQWTALRFGESVTISTGPVSENATEMKVGVVFKAMRFSDKAYWVFSALIKTFKLLR